MYKKRGIGQKKEVGNPFFGMVLRSQVLSTDADFHQKR